MKVALTVLSATLWLSEARHKRMQFPTLRIENSVNTSVDYSKFLCFRKSSNNIAPQSQPSISEKQQLQEEYEVAPDCYRIRR
jgi:hypothetical protein